MPKVAEVLAGLQEERARLLKELSGVERAIAALEEVLDGAPARTPEASPVSAPVPAPVLLPEPAPPPAPRGPYASASSLYEAVAAYLTEAGEPRTARQIAQALQAGGYPTRATDFPGTVRTMLLRFVSSRSWGIHQTKTGSRWYVERA